jgi:hypothetical protein
MFQYRPLGHRRARPRRDVYGDGSAFRLRLRGAMGHTAARRHDQGDCRSGYGGAAYTRCLAWRELADRRRVCGRGGRTYPVRAVVFALAPCGASAIGRRRRARRDQPILDQVVVALHARRPMGGRHRPLADHSQGAHLRADRRHGRGADHLPAGAHRRHPQLGLSILLVARCHADAAGADGRRIL